MLDSIHKSASDYKNFIRNNQKKQDAKRTTPMIDVHTSTMLMIIYTQTQMSVWEVFESL
jgi:hypothetical protein